MSLFRAFLFVLVAPLAVLAGCDSGTPSCSTGATRACTCTSAATGTQSCGADGTFGTCMCTTPADGGMTDAGMTDAGMTDAGAMGSDAGTTPTCMPLDDTMFSDQLAEMGDNALYGTAASDDGASALSIEAYFDLGAVEGPQSITLTGENYATCAQCVLFYLGCDDEGDCDRTFLASAGTLTYTSLTTTAMAGTLSNVRLVEVTLDPDTFESTVVPGGRSYCADLFTFDMMLPRK